MWKNQKVLAKNTSCYILLNNLPKKIMQSEDNLMKEIISVIIPVFNTKPYLTKCLHSIISSTYPHLEILCIDNESTDGSYEYLKKFASIDSRIKVLQEIRKGVSYARNAGLQHATGTYISFIDSDDWVHPQFFEHLINCANQYDADVVICRNVDVVDFETPNHSIKSGTIKQYSLQKTLEDFHMKSRIWARIYKRTIIANHKFPNHIHFGEDAIFNIDVLCSTNNIKIFLLESQLYYYNIRQDSAVHTINHYEILKSGEWLIRRSNTIEKQNIKKILLLQGIKFMLAGRYLSMFCKDAKKIKTYCNHLINEALNQLQGIRTFSFKERVQYCICTDPQKLDLKI